MANETVDKYSGEVGDQSFEKTEIEQWQLFHVGCLCCLLIGFLQSNVWTYEIIGRYEVFTVIDNDNEVIPKPYFGHKGQRYVRKEDHHTTSV